MHIALRVHKADTEHIRRGILGLARWAHNPQVKVAAGFIIQEDVAQDFSFLSRPGHEDGASATRARRWARSQPGDSAPRLVANGEADRKILGDALERHALRDPLSLAL